MLLYARKAQSKPKNYKNEKRKQGKYKKKKTKQQISYKRERELRKEGRKSLVVSPQTRDQLNRLPLNEARI